ncbi:MAG: hypothetical protein II399_01855, partial [Lachnospiraceae bacterium]|nr:hypothetical protein [Lachnospiraceae bacterium]
MYVEKINAMANAVNLREKLGETQDGESAKSVLNLMFLNIQKIINCGAVCAEYQTAAILSVKTFKSIRENEDFVDIYRKYGDGIESAKIAMKNLNGLYSRFVDGEPVFNVDFQNKEEILIACLNFLSECANLEFDRQTKLVTERVQKDNEPKV